MTHYPTTFLSLIGLALGGLSMACAEDTGKAPGAKNLSTKMDTLNQAETSQPGIVLTGYADIGYIYNFVDTQGVVTARPYGSDQGAKGDFSVHQVKLVLEKALNEDNDLQTGFRLDLWAGEDAADFSGNTGGGALDGDSLYVQQAFLQLRIPVGNGLDLWIGKWQQPLGFETEERATNLNITGGYSALGDPGGTIGVLGIYPLHEQWELLFGLMNGSGADDHFGLGGEDDGAALTGQIRYASQSGNYHEALGVYYAWDGDPGYNANDTSVTGLNLCGDWAPILTNDKLLFAYNVTWIHMDSFAPGSGDSDYLGIGVYAKYLLTNALSIATRAEYAYTDDNQFLDLTGGLARAPNLGSNDLWSWTATLGFDVFDNVLLRAEYRLDWGNDLVNVSPGTLPFHSEDIAHTIAFEAVYSF